MGLQAWHKWSEEHARVAHCESEQGQRHVHDQSYAPELCFFCTFLYTKYTENTLAILHTTEEPPLVYVIAGYYYPIYQSAIDSYLGRGPPIIT